MLSPQDYRLQFQLGLNSYITCTALVVFDYRFRNYTLLQHFRMIDVTASRPLQTKKALQSSVQVTKKELLFVAVRLKSSERFLDKRYF